ncbi:hypothetical protein K0817_000415 [Microbacterium sp. HD4P20]|uniref:hypothetical protein n=1 Tax=Microbacterium sp. HD4P20 TaxID=2864874 RepID=UPI001C63BEA6|nr:hypothetical protein [Microbacterium sp. HD4P20]MCP2635028.1 hypothetical protein [Microbacterium sp. HD4P20]
MTSKKRATAAVAAACLGLLLSGCALGGTSYAALDRERQAGDELPEAVADGSDDIDADSARHVGEHDGVEFWLARMDEPQSVCLVVYPSDEDWVVGCSSDGGQLGVSGRSGVYSLVPDGAPVPTGATKITENLYQLGG